MKGAGVNRKLKINKNFKPCPVDEGDEMYPNGIFVFNITKMAQHIVEQGIPCEKVVVKDYPRSSNRFNEDHLPSVDVTKPIIVAEISPGRFNVIDGNHRMEKARRLGIEQLMAFRLGPDQHMQFLTTEKGYLAYIDYWNDKLKTARQ